MVCSIEIELPNSTPPVKIELLIGHEANEGRQGHRLESRGRRVPDRDDGHGLGSAGGAALDGRCDVEETGKRAVGGAAE